ncbi:MurR/RpiR family transcriptional regulator [Amphibacillus sp. Q70]|uniref:MurR/RpiR family transcriptional regulator n=1 Tax=Amphibacillus sp. Q70 TaxID=3453416 RepID=UPI003F88025D
MNINNLGILNKLSTYINSSPRGSNEYSISSYLIVNIDRIPEITVNEVVDECFVSISAVRRFCKELDYDNFSNLKKSLTDIIYPSNIHKRSFPNVKVYRQLLNEQIIDKVSMMNETINDETIVKICDLIHYYNDVYFLCANNTASNLTRFQQELYYTNKIIHIISSGFENEISNFMQNSDESLIIVVSVSGVFSNAIYDVIREKTDSYKVLITSNQEGSYHHIYNSIVYLTEESTNDDIYGVLSKYGITFLFDLISEQYIYKYR